MANHYSILISYLNSEIDDDLQKYFFLTCVLLMKIILICKFDSIIVCKRNYTFIILILTCILLFTCYYVINCFDRYINLLIFMLDFNIVEHIISQTCLKWPYINTIKYIVRILYYISQRYLDIGLLRFRSCIF